MKFVNCQKMRTTQIQHKGACGKYDKIKGRCMWGEGGKYHHFYLVRGINVNTLQPISSVYLASTPYPQPKNPIELAFVLDGSNSLTRTQFESIKKLVSNILDRYTISPEETRVAVIEYSDRPEVLIFLNDYKDRNTLQEAVDDIRPSRGPNTATDEALKLAAEHIFSPERGSRPGASKALILVTDDMSTGTQSLRDAAEPLRKKGVPVYVVTIGSRYDVKEIKDLSPSPGYVISVDQPKDVENLGPKITNTIDVNIEKSM
jgi:hypothetical protein